GQDRVYDRLPALDGQFFDRRRGAETGIVEQHIEPAEALLGFDEQILDGGGIGDIRRHGEHVTAGPLYLARVFFEPVEPPARDDCSETLLGEGDRSSLADP